MSCNHHALGSKERPNKRIASNSLTVVKRRCKFCGHHKGLDSVTIRKCARRKREVER